MKIIHGEDIKIGVLNDKYESTYYVDKEVRDGSMKYIQAYDNPQGINPVFVRLDRLWQRVLRIFDYDTSSKRILELGCGATKGTTESKYFGPRYQPWLGRFLHVTRSKTGIDYVGVDIGDLSSENFRNISMDLLEENCLITNFAENQFDLVIAYMLFNSPELEKQVEGTDEMKDASQQSSLRLKANLLPQLEIILKPEGTFLWQGGNKDLFGDN